MATLRLRYVHSFIDKTGRVRFYFRHQGKRWPLPGEPGTGEFAARYDELLQEHVAARRANNVTFGPNTLGLVIEKYLGSVIAGPTSCPAASSSGRPSRWCWSTGRKALLADEPTGELDTATAAEVFGALQRANTELGVTVLIVTHDPAVSSVVRRVVALIRDGRTSTETHRHATTGDDGEVAQHAVEYAVLDRAGRLQLPREMTEPLGLRDLVRLEAEPDHIGVWPDRRGPQRARWSPPTCWPWWR